MKSRFWLSAIVIPLSVASTRLALGENVVTPPAASVDESPKAATRDPVPGLLPQKEAEQSIRALFADDFRKRLIPDRVALAQKLLREASLTAESARNFVLLKLAADVAASAGDLKLALEAVEKLKARFDVDAIEYKLSVFNAAARSSAISTIAEPLVSDAIENAQKLADRGDYENAGKFEQAAETSVRYIRNGVVADRDRAALKQLHEDALEFKKIKPAIERLSQSPDDPSANLELGKFYCFKKSDWDKGLPMLAKGSDAALKALADQEKSAPTTADAKAAVGDGWWEYGEKERVVRSECRDRAVTWYTAALPNAGEALLRKIKPRIKLQEGTQRIVDLLAMIDPQKDSRRGGPWEITADGLTCPPGVFAQLEIPYAPPAEYDLHAKFSTSGPGGPVAFILPTQKLSMAVLFTNLMVGIEGIDGKPAQLGPAHVPNPSFVVNKIYDLIIQHRVDHIIVILDGKPLLEYRTPDGYTEVKYVNWGSATFPTFCVGADQGAKFKALELKEMSGPGKKLRQ